jgi:hypothetical protein
MTTQTQEAKINQAKITLLMKKSHIWLLVLAAFLILAIISGAFMVSQPRGEEFVRNGRALESISARYQGMADLYPAREKARTQRALQIISARYQGMADLYPSGNKANTHQALEILSSRYQGMADRNATGVQAETLRVLNIISARYQSTADLYAVGRKVQTQRALEVLSSRYQGMVDFYASGNKADTHQALENHLCPLPSPSRYVPSSRRMMCLSFPWNKFSFQFLRDKQKASS